MASDLWDDFRGKPEKQQYETQQAPWANQQPYLTNLFGRANDLYTQGPYNYAASPFTTQAQNMAVATANDPNSLTAMSKGQIGDTISGKYLDPNTNPFFSGAVNDALGLAKSQVAGMYGGPAGQNVNNSGFQEQLARTLGNVATTAYSNNYGRERANQLNATTLAPQFDYAQAQALGKVGAMDEARSYQQYMAPWQTLQAYQAGITGNYGMSGVSEAPWTSQIYDNMYATHKDGMNAMASVFSDVRLKENIERIGTHDTGIGIYKYTYKGDSTPQIGVLAQEVEKVMPEAVGESQGFKTVNYKMI